MQGEAGDGRRPWTRARGSSWQRGSHARLAAKGSPARALGSREGGSSFGGNSNRATDRVRCAPWRGSWGAKRAAAATMLGGLRGGLQNLAERAAASNMGAAFAAPPQQSLRTGQRALQMQLERERADEEDGQPAQCAPRVTGQRSIRRHLMGSRCSRAVGTTPRGRPRPEQRKEQRGGELRA